MDPVSLVLIAGGTVAGAAALKASKEKKPKQKAKKGKKNVSALNPAFAMAVATSNKIANPFFSKDSDPPTGTFNGNVTASMSVEVKAKFIADIKAKIESGTDSAAKSACEKAKKAFPQNPSLLRLDCNLGGKDMAKRVVDIMAEDMAIQFTGGISLVFGIDAGSDALKATVDYAQKAGAKFVDVITIW